MTFIILDMEWNQPPINGEPYRAPFPLAGEIIQIGAIKLDANFQESDRYQTYISPTFYPTIQPYVRKITGITEKTVKSAPPFPKEMERFFSWCGEDFSFITWGPDDLPMLCDNLLAHGMDTALIPSSYNLQHIFNAQTNGENRQWSLANACEFLGIEQKLPGHNALADAYHTALICSKLDMKRGIAQYRQELQPIRHYCHPTKCQKSRTVFPQRAAKDVVVKGFSTRKAALNDRRITALCCPECGTELSYERFLTQTNNKRIAIGTCSVHGSYFATVYLQAQTDGTYTANRRLYPATQPLLQRYEKVGARLSRKSSAPKPKKNANSDKNTGS